VKGSTNGPDGPDDVDAAFAEIVADLEREGVGVDVSTEIADKDVRDDSDAAPATSGGAEPSGEVWRGHGDWDWTWSSDDEHYVPPEPPPLPRPKPVTVLALVLLVIGIVLLVAPNLLAVSARVATPIALISLAVGIGLVALRIRSGPPRDSDPDNGAQV
jgi:hypothetical protein